MFTFDGLSCLFILFCVAVFDAPTSGEDGNYIFIIHYSSGVPDKTPLKGQIRCFFNPPLILNYIYELYWGFHLRVTVCRIIPSAHPTRPSSFSFSCPHIELSRNPILFFFSRCRPLLTPSPCLTWSFAAPCWPQPVMTRCVSVVLYIRFIYQVYLVFSQT